MSTIAILRSLRSLQRRCPEHTSLSEQEVRSIFSEPGKIVVAWEVVEELFSGPVVVGRRSRHRTATGFARYLYSLRANRFHIRPLLQDTP